ncbi:MAG: hypothetical protein PHY93_03780 [Bacteriovorax sp.]|nr:hypothetical protein [Bacteriovorax sp.]
MKSYLLVPLTLCLHALPAMSAISWDNPAVLCPEEILPSGLACPDLSRVENPYTDFPDATTKEEITDWKNNKAADLKVCRNSEVLRREQIKAGSFSAATLEQAWMVVDGGKQVKEKLAAIQSASLKYGIPPQILIGAMKQESLMSSLGVSPDGGNYSCGMSQLNIQEWCQSMNRLPEEERAALGWPAISCDEAVLPTDIVKPFYEIAIKNVGNRPSYQLSAEDFKGITSKDVTSSFSNTSIQDKRFLAVTSFVHNCQNIPLSISFKAQTLKSLFDNFVPKSLKDAELYTEGKTFPRVCKDAYSARAYPLHTGWLLAVAMYNAGPVQAKLLEHYYQVKNNNFPAINPLGLIEALHWGGKWKKGSDTVVFKDQDGDKLSQRWFKSCIVQRHVARVIQHVTLPAESIAKSLDQEGCKMTGVPEYRQVSSGIKEK